MERFGLYRRKLHRPAIYASKLVFFLSFCVWSSVEAICGIVQALGGGTTQNAFFVMTGNFNNPGPFGGFLAVSMAVTGSYMIKYMKRRKGLYRGLMMTAACLSFCLCFLVLPASMSRTGWIALAVALLLACVRDRAIRRRIASRPYISTAAGIVAVCLLATAFFLKKDSAIGRLHIWRMECLAMAEHPLGTGPGTALGTYGKTQEEFFRNNLDTVPAKVIEVAGCPEYAFNEYLHVGMEYGVPGMLLFLAAIGIAVFLLVRAGSVYAGGLVAWAVFAFASYPLSIPQLDILLGLLLAAAALCLPSLKRHPVLGCLPATVCLGLGIVLAVKSSQTPEFRTLYEEGYALYLSEEYEESLRVLSEGAAISSDPIFHVMMGRDFEALGNYRKAEDEYLTAYYMVPCRIYPLVRLARLHLREGRDSEAAAIASKASAMPVNEKNLNMIQLREEAIFISDSLRALSR